MSWWGLYDFKPLRVNDPKLLSMSPAELSSLKWGEDGELSSRDTWNLVNLLTKVEEETKASNLLHLSPKHSCGEHRSKKKPA